MPNPKKKQGWLVETDKTELKTLQDQVVMIEEIFLLDINTVINSKVNNSSVNDKDIDYTPIRGTIDNLNSQVNLINNKLNPLHERFKKYLKSKKRNVVTNFIIKIFTFGKINRNKDIESELKNIDSACNNIKEKCKNINKDLKVKENKIWDIVQTRDSGLVIENKQLIQKNKDLEILVTNDKAKIKQLEINMKENDNKIEELEKANEEKINFIGNKNIKFDSHCVTLEKVIKSQKEEINFYKERIKELEDELKLRDSGIESAIEATDSNLEDTFEKGKINAQEKTACHKKIIKPHVVQIN